jgi:ribosomal protein S18 acetylase RimI-like enzyme
VADSAITIRPVAANDETPIVDLLLAWGGEGTWFDLPGPARAAPDGVGVAWRAGEFSGWVEPDWATLLDVPSWAFLVAEVIDEGIVGFARGKSVEVTGKLTMAIPEGGDLFELTELYVRPEWRSRGVGSRLLTTLLDEATAHGLERMTLVSATAQPDDLIRFYRRHGFEPWWVEFFRNVEPRAF